MIANSQKLNSSATALSKVTASHIVVSSVPQKALLGPRQQDEARPTGCPISDHVSFYSSEFDHLDGECSRCIEKVMFSGCLTRLLTFCAGNSRRTTWCLKQILSNAAVD
jgi:hypothetical protein